MGSNLIFFGKYVSKKMSQSESNSKKGSESADLKQLGDLLCVFQRDGTREGYILVLLA